MTAPYYEDDQTTIWHGDCLDVLRTLPDCSVDAIVTDPPYDLTAGKKGGTGAASVDLSTPYGRARISAGNGAGGFMGQAWDATGIAFRVDLWTEALRVLKPGGHLLSFGGTRTWHRMATAIEDAGFEVRDSIAWLYGSGFPKSLDVSKAIDKAAGATREVVGTKAGRGARPRNDMRGGQYGSAPTDLIDTSAITAPATPEAGRFHGWGTALKPAFEPIVVARKPLSGTVAATVLQYGTGAINVDGCRVPGVVPSVPQPDFRHVNGVSTHLDAHKRNGEMSSAPGGRWPTNVLLDGSQADALDEQSGTLKSGANPTRRGSDKFRDAYGDFKGQEECTPARGADEGGASRFFPTFRYQAKAPTRERVKVGDVAHPTVKPLELMRWLVRLVTPPGGLVLEPFAGSGTTVEAAVLEGFQCLAIEREADYLPLILARLARHKTTDDGLAIEPDAPTLFDLDGDAA